MIKWLYIFICISLSSCTNLIFYPMPNHILNPNVLGIEYKNIKISTTNNLSLHGWWLQAKDHTNGIIIFFHGNAQNISTHLQHVYWLVDHNYDVVIIDYRGYGKSEGKPSIPGSIDDIKSGVKYVYNAPKSTNKPIFVIGQSMGGSLSIAALADDKIKNNINALVTISAFSDYRKIAQHALSNSWVTWPLQWPLSFTINNSYSPERLIKYLSPVPILIIHGNEDKVVPSSHAKTIYTLAPEHKFLEILPAGHNDVLNNKKNRQVLLKYLNKFMIESLPIK